MTIITDEEKKKLSDATAVLLSMVTRMQGAGKDKLTYKGKIESHDYNVHMIENIIRAVYELGKSEVKDG